MTSSNVRYTSGRLRLGGERRGEEGPGNAGNEGSPLHHSIT
jgi:hypothetical protein